MILTELGRAIFAMLVVFAGVWQLSGLLHGKRLMRQEDMLVLLGMALISAGLWVLHPPAALIGMGIMLGGLGLGCAIKREAQEDGR